ncbi:MAG: NADPH-dependent 7-cyano-7-deazaguanine reductase QueF [Pseudomonadales bacterium]
MDIPLGKPTDYPERYDPGLLAPMARATSRAAMGIGVVLPFVGNDVWNGYEFSWLNERGMPRVAGLRLQVDAHSPCMVESKSMKLYLNGFAQARFPSADDVRETLAKDLSAAFGDRVAVTLLDPAQIESADGVLPGESLDAIDVDVDTYARDPVLLETNSAAGAVTETLHTHLFRSLCPVTAQPDWASLLIRYSGPPVDRAGLLRYLISYRNHAGFHEATVEQIFVDLKARCACDRLLVAGAFLRRGGLDINPLRADAGESLTLPRLSRQ